MLLDKVVNIDLSMFKYMDANILCTDINHQHLYVNDPVAKFLNIASNKDIVGLDYYQIMNLAGILTDCESFIANDKEVIATSLPKLGILEVPNVMEDGTVNFFRSNLFPLLDKYGDILGVLCVSNCINESIKTEYFESIEQKVKHDNQYTDLTSREKEVIVQLIRRGGNKNIAKSLNVSPRTIECHIENIKNKLNLYSREEIINAVL